MATKKQSKQWWRNKTIFSTDYEKQLGPWEEIVEQYKEYLEINDNPVPKDEDISDDVIWNFINDQMYWMPDAFFDQVPDKTVVCHADIGLWDGRRDGGQYGDLKKLLTSAGSNCDEIDIKYNGLTLTVIGHHHDGTNYYYFRELTPKGQAWLKRNESQSREEICEYLFNTKGMSRNIPCWM